MKHARLIAAMIMGLGLTACASVETATRNAPLELPEAAPTPISVDVVGVNVTVPDTMTISEANGYYPKGDIVWREDPLGDRREQVKTIVENAFNIGTKDMEGAVPVVLDVEMHYFHALSEKSRYTIGGMHEFEFTYVLRNPETGAAMTQPKYIKTEFKGFGGSRAINAERNGVTQKLRITSYLADFIQKELGAGVDGATVAQAQTPIDQI